MYMSILFSSQICHHNTFRFFFFNDTATTEIYTLSLHDALPISAGRARAQSPLVPPPIRVRGLQQPGDLCGAQGGVRSEEHTSELQSQSNLVCRLLLEKKKKKKIKYQNDGQR